MKKVITIGIVIGCTALVGGILGLRKNRVCTKKEKN